MESFQRDSLALQLHSSVQNHPIDKRDVAIVTHLEKHKDKPIITTSQRKELAEDGVIPRKFYSVGDLIGENASREDELRDLTRASFPDC